MSYGNFTGIKTETHRKEKKLSSRIQIRKYELIITIGIHRANKKKLGNGDGDNTQTELHIVHYRPQTTEIIPDVTVALKFV